MGATDINNWRRQNSDQITVELVLVDGTELRGKMLLARDKTLQQYMNLAGEPFLEFEDQELGPVLLAKTSLRSMRRFEMPRATQLEDSLQANDVYDPYAILGVGKTITVDEAHHRFQQLISVYHPDRFASAGLPPEMSEYVMAMAKRITAAYAEIKRIIETQRKADAARAAQAQHNRRR
jgi:hypothetical protein